MTLRVSAALGSKLSLALGDALDLPMPTVSNQSIFDVCRSFAFSADDDSEFAWWYLRSQVFSKFDDLDPSAGRQKIERAMSDFALAEAACARANERLVEWWSRAHLDKEVWSRARALVGRILGPFPMDEFPWRCGFGPGASTGVSRQRASHQNKWALAAHITEEALPYMSAFHQWAGMSQLNRFLRIVNGNRVTTVPKNFKKDRVIAIEPDWNAFLQKGVGALIRSRLQRFGLLQREAQEINSGLARLGSWTGHLATLDLSRASDSVSIALCEALVPEDWFRVLIDLRSPSGLVNGEEVVYHKISSMGNGFTFELETLLFYALTCASCKKESWRNISVYGDDIICPAQHVDKVVETLNDAGFELNPEKSFSTGPFRESCGGHWFKGRDVRPFYLKHDPIHLGDVVNTHNSIYDFCKARSMSDFGLFSEVVRSYRRCVPRKYRGPQGYDGVLWSDWDEARPTWCSDEQTYHQHCFVKKPRGYKNVRFRSGALLSALWLNTPEDDYSEVRMSRLARKQFTYGSARLRVDREAWSELTVRIA